MMLNPTNLLSGSRASQIPLELHNLNSELILWRLQITLSEFHQLAGFPEIL